MARSLTRLLALPAALACALALGGCAPLPRPAPGDSDGVQRAGATPSWLRILGTAAIAPGTEWGGSVFGGISGIDRDPATDEYLLISDDRSARGPARVYTARLRYGVQGLAPPEITGVHLLRAPDGRPFAARSAARVRVDVPDAESVRWLPGAAQFLWTSEGDFGRGFGPQMRAAHADGSHARSWTLPPAFQPGPGHGPRGNGTLEGLALAPDGRSAWLAMELPWRQDGPTARHGRPGAPVRITQLDLDSGRPLRQIAYQPDAPPQPRALPFGPELNGVSEILADGPHHLLVLERAYSTGRGFAARLYRIDTRSGSDTLALPALAPGSHRPAAKTLVADFAALGLPVDNLEGMAWGAPLADGSCVLVLVSDDNFNPAQATQFIAAEYRPPGGGNAACGTTGGP
ncbi:Uncharacterized conserved protein [Oryzisolibacter propanilivorax]|uniref:Uncharacterized conserved protein n=1 Tax=Oryzisolibacter propanilivorax TaxID=1527607 RepID=A0A1G9RDT8_9BURK|nr:esterase-like activity of phytase family protein [Oryzisolibacter propanilivorax]SDM21351.1 Uncharacterized conserved protein [Oryzisolibacter propanilivorax]